VIDELSERSGRCRTGLAVSLRADLLSCSQRDCSGREPARMGERHWDGGSVVTASRGVDPDGCRSGRGTVFRLAAACEGLDDDHAAAAAATRTRQHVGLIGGRGLGRLSLFQAGWHGEQLARPCDVGGAIAICEQSVVADAVQALGQHV
jgi:hypothetical protein